MKYEAQSSDVVIVGKKDVAASVSVMFLSEYVFSPREKWDESKNRERVRAKTLRHVALES